jgi:glycosyltransferase involved in cell wall biosynthesis
MKGNIIIIQPQIPTYRLDFFERLSKIYGKRFIVYHGAGTFGALTPKENPWWAAALGKLVSFYNTFFWQKGLVSIPLCEKDTLIIFSNPRYLSNIVLALRAKFTGAKLIMWGHLRSSTSSSHGTFFRFIFLSMADVLLFYTAKEMEILRSSDIFLKNKRHIYALNNGLDISKISLNRIQYIPEKRRRSILFIGRVVQKSNLLLLISALLEIDIKNRPILEVIGDGCLMQEYREYALASDLEEFINWHGALTLESDIANVANKATVFCYPGSVGLSLIHGMSYGLPSVIHSSSENHMPEYAAFVEGVHGLSFVDGSIKSLAHTLTEILKDNSRLSKMSNSCIIQTENNFNTAEMAKNFNKMILNTF